VSNEGSCGNEVGWNAVETDSVSSSSSSSDGTSPGKAVNLVVGAGAVERSAHPRLLA